MEGPSRRFDADLLSIDGGDDGVTDRVGFVHIVGAGPGAADLLTIRAWRLLQEADVVLHDALVSSEVLDCIPVETLRVDVGKRVGSGGAGQCAIHAAMIAHARAGRRVVRLKSGDPTLFARLGEEIVALARASVPFAVVPGITAASGCAAALGIPLTDRAIAHDVHFVTAHRSAGVVDAPEDWRPYARDDATLVIYMGARRAREIFAALRACGRAGDTPVAIVTAGTCASARVCRTRLDASRLPRLSACHPVLLIVGRVVDYMRCNTELARTSYA